MSRPPALTNLTGHQVDFFTQADTLESAVSMSAGTADSARLPETETASGDIVVEGVRIPVVAVEPVLDGAKLPAAVNGVALLVPRLTALAARDRREDLLFPHSEVRNERGTVIGARTLGFYPPTKRPPQLPPGHDAGMDSGERTSLMRQGWHRLTATRIVLGLVRRTWIMALLFTLANVLLSASLGTILALEEPDQRLTWAKCLLAVLLTAGALLLVLALAAWEKRNRMRSEVGTAFVIDEQSANWTREETTAFKASLDAEFDRVMTIPGPSQPGMRWSWNLDPGSSARWGAHVDRLVHAFWVSRDLDSDLDRAETPNSLFMWTFWPVAIAFGSRALRGRRGLRLRVGRRPSFGRQGADYGDGSAADSHEFAWQAAATQPGRTTFQPYETSLSPTVVGNRYPVPDAPPPRVRLLLVRLSSGTFAGSDDDGRLTAVKLETTFGTPAADVLTRIPSGTAVTVEELRDLPAEASGHRWVDFPGLAQGVAEWIMERDIDASEHVFLAMIAPQEVAVGVGMLATTVPPGARRWPKHLWPLLYDGRGGFVVPNLDLGSSAHTSSQEAR